MARSATHFAVFSKMSLRVKLLRRRKAMSCTSSSVLLKMQQRVPKAAKCSAYAS